MSDIKGPPLRTPPPPPPKEPEAMTTNQIKITHHPATETAPQHWRSSDGFWSTDGYHWQRINRQFNPLVDAFFSQILNAEEEPRHAEIDDWVRSIDSPACFQVKFVDHGEGTVWSEEEGDGGMGLRHGEYTIVDPPQPLTAKGSDITQKDGVWEKKFGSGCSYSRFLVQNNKLIVKHDSFGSFVDPQKSPPASIVTYTHISDDPRDLTDWGAE